MGRVDCSSFDHLDHCIWSGNVCDEKDFSFTKSTQEEDCRESRDERRELLLAPSTRGENDARSEHRIKGTYGEWRARRRFSTHLRYILT